MKKTILCVTLIIMFTFSAVSQLVNMNPDPNGTPWLTGGASSMTPELQQEIDAIPTMVRQSFIDPPDAVDNSQHKFMRPIFLQEHGSCAQASGVAYIFTYEINCLRDLAADHEDYNENQYCMSSNQSSLSWYN